MAPWKCPDCGAWWAGLEHRCQPPMTTTGAGPFIVRPYTPSPGSGSTASAPWCGICLGWHIPGRGDCTKTYCGW